MTAIHSASRAPSARPSPNETVLDNSRSNRKIARLKSPLRHWNGPAPRESGAGSAKISLIRREDDELDSRRRDRRKRLVIGSAFRQPHPGRLAPEAEDEVVDTPSDLQLAIARRQQRQNRMAVRLRDRVAMPTVAGGIQRVATSHRAIRGLAMRLQPSGERRADIEAERLVIIADVNDRALHRVGMSIGGVAFAEDSLVPVLKRRRAMLRANQAGPRALARGLVEMPVNNDVARFTHYKYVAPPGRAAIARPTGPTAGLIRLVCRILRSLSSRNWNLSANYPQSLNNSVHRGSNRELLK